MSSYKSNDFNFAKLNRNFLRASCEPLHLNSRDCRRLQKYVYTKVRRNSYWFYKKTKLVFNFSCEIETWNIEIFQNCNQLFKKYNVGIYLPRLVRSHAQTCLPSHLVKHKIFHLTIARKILTLKHYKFNPIYRYQSFIIQLAKWIS